MQSSSTVTIIAVTMSASGLIPLREAVVLVIEDFNRRRRVEDFLKLAGSFPDFPTNEEIEADDLLREELLNAKWNREP